MKLLNAAAIAALILTAQPMVGSVTGTSFVDTGAAFAKGKSEKKVKKAKKAKKAKPAQANANTGKKPAKVTGQAARTADATPKPKNIHAQLKGLNSLNRNINGLMNSSDPKMDGFRAYVMAGGDLQLAQDGLDAALSSYDPLKTDYDALLAGLALTTPTDDMGYTDLMTQLQVISTAAAPDVADYTDPLTGLIDQAAFNTATTAWVNDVATASQAIADYDAVYAAFQDTSAAQGAFDDAADATSPAALLQAIVDGLNATGAGPVTAEDISPEMIRWVSDQMGVGDADGLIDDYLNGLSEDEANLIDPTLDDEADDEVEASDS